MIHKKKKEEGKFRLFRPYSRPISAISGVFRPFSGLFRPYRPPADTTRYGRYGPILAESAQFGANQSRFGTNQAASARIELSRRESEKKNIYKKTQTRSDVRANASDAGAAPLVPHLCFLACNPPPKPTRSNHHRRPTRSAMHRHQNSTAKEGPESWKRR